MFQTVKDAVRFRFAPLASVALLAGGCTITSEIKLDGPEGATLPAARLPVSVDLVLSPEFRSHVHERQINDSVVYAFPVGSASAAHLENAAKSLFAEPRIVSGAAAKTNPAADAVMRVEIEEFQYAASPERQAQARVSYLVDLKKPDGTAIGRWHVAATAAGTPPESAFSFVDPKAVAGEVATKAIGNAVADLAAGFSEVPEVARWLRETGALPGGPRARTATGSLALSAEGYGSEYRELGTFNARLSEAGILAVEISVGYSGPGAVLIRHGDVRLRLAGGSVIAPSPTNDVFEHTRSSDHGGLASALAGPLVGLAVSANAAQENNQKMLDYESLRLKDATLRNGAKASGIVYFVLPDGTGVPPDGARLQVAAVDVDSGIAFGDSVALAMKPPLSQAEIEEMRKARETGPPKKGD